MAGPRPWFENHLNQHQLIEQEVAAKFPSAAELMVKASEDVLAFRHFPSQRWKKVWSTNLLERLVGAVLLEQDEHWQLEGRRIFSTESVAEINPIATKQSVIQANDLTSQSSGFIVKQRGAHALRE